MLVQAQVGNRLFQLPVSACFNAKAICSSMYRDFFISSASPKDFTRLKILTQWIKKQVANAARQGSHRISEMLVGWSAKLVGSEEGARKKAPEADAFGVGDVGNLIAGTCRYFNSLIHCRC